MQLIQINKSIFSAGEFQYKLVDDVQIPLKKAFEDWEHKNLIGVVRNLRKAFKSLQEIPEPTKENVRHVNTRILIGIRDEFFKHLNFSCHGQHYIRMFRTIINYIIVKYDYDRFYHDMANWWYGEMIERGWQLQGYNRPSVKLWNTIVPATRKRLEDSVNCHYDNLQTRIKVINDTLGDSEEAKTHRVSRREQFTRNILNDFEREVERWRN